MSQKNTHVLCAKHLPEFPDEETSAQWIWPSFAGSDILDELLKYALRPRLQADGTWVINAKNDWHCFSKSHWLYTDAEQARDALRANMRMHLQCSPILSENRCVAIACEINETWRLWQIVHREPTLADDLAKALGYYEQLDKLALETFRCATRYADALEQAMRYPPLLNNLSLDNLGMDASIQVTYLDCVDDAHSDIIQPTTVEALVEAIEQTFADPIAKAIEYLDVVAVINEFEQIDGFEQQYLLDILIKLLRQ
ncbi:MAG: hypothetical protein DRR16_02890 [Candidatus Parabeggiatoa sp. nov. 3]|nr:MAG: hypothetical protein DRR00_07365 [Gammaproteobacteria bacterium]RKZ68865.1 MAG: hypothetical protein DRQ99_02515 [Gammaproteobacteria bacterium]RKZ89268.1 MAG: hypothetical protein DRR16_02890 [Gammaproteobacteria bacterium]